MTARVVDFDAFRAEQKSEPLELLLGGRTYELPPSLPATLALDLIRLNAGGPEAEIPPEKIEEFGAAIFGGGERLRLVMDEGGVTLAELPELLKQILQMYAGGPGPNRAARRQGRGKRSRS